MFYQDTIFGICSLTHQEEEVWPSGTHPMLFPELSCICIPSFRPVALLVFLAKIPFLAFFPALWPEFYSNSHQLTPMEPPSPLPPPPPQRFKALVGQNVWEGMANIQTDKLYIMVRYFIQNDSYLWIRPAPTHPPPESMHIHSACAKQAV